MSGGSGVQPKLVKAEWMERQLWEEPKMVRWSTLAVGVLHGLCILLVVRSFQFLSC
jgi:hypothetical protein